MEGVNNTFFRGFLKKKSRGMGPQIKFFFTPSRSYHDEGFTLVARRLRDQSQLYNQQSINQTGLSTAPRQVLVSSILYI